ncbi:hypothetical protein GCM10022271_07760 [Corallibacter vietnamensis]|uniref:Uncharacterized protein n=1 Tax=Corallibacter vietnamensis TaxID=904130 RepID=A0ABP7GZR1_9FLAO
MNIFYLILAYVSPLLDVSNNLVPQEIKTNTSVASFNFLDIIFYLIFGLSILLNIVFILNRVNNNSRQNSKSTKKHDNDFENFYKIENSSLKNKISSLENKLHAFQKSNKLSSESKYNNLEKIEENQPIQSPIKTQLIEDEKPQTVDFEIPKPIAIYLPSPFENNRFSIEDVSNEQMPTSLYQIILDASNTTGKLLIIENADFTRALNSPDHYLEKACIYENAFSPNANGINIVEPGKVKLENQDWLITQKIKIKFI